MHERRSPLLERLQAFAADLWWTALPGAHDLWRALDPLRWEALAGNPLRLLQEAGLAAAPPGWAEQAEALLARWEAQLAAAPRADSPKIAYFCMEFGIHESLPIYSGGLGVLAGDHVRSAADLGLDFVAVGLLYRQGYFQQVLRGGVQVAAWAPYDLSQLAISPVNGPDGARLTVEVPYEAGTMLAQAWKAKIGGVTLYLLDTDIPENPPPIRGFTQQLYGGDSFTRIGQEVLLGLGGVRLLKSVGFEPDVLHMNEGHSAFLVLELWADGLRAGMNRDQAWQRARQRCVFTTHTPVPAGHDAFYWHDVNRILGPYREGLGLPPGSFMSLGREDIADLDSPLSMTVLALKGSRAANGVSALHGEVSRAMFKRLAIPIGHVTNGVHAGAWLAPETEALFDAHLPAWREHLADREFWWKAESLPADALLHVRASLRRKLVAEVRHRVGRRLLDESALTIGFARRFAPYKRGDLLFTDPDRLVSLLERGVQVVFGGKAHPADKQGQEIIARVLKWTRDPRFRDRIVLLQNYEMDLGRLLTQGCDVWLNTPRRPREASGTSGQKAALNGNPNCSVLDGWWPEAFDGANGWSIGDDREWTDEAAQDAADAVHLYETLESDILPAFADKARWAKIMAHTLATCVPVFNTHRMVGEYLEKAYKVSSS